MESNKFVEYSEKELNEITITNIIKMLSERNFLSKDNLENNIKKYVAKIDNKLLFEIKSDHSNDTIAVKFFLFKINTIKKVPDVEEFLKKYANVHKIVIVKDLHSKKGYNQLMSFKNIEVFKQAELLINLIDCDIIPKHILLSEEEKNAFLEAYSTKKKTMSRINVTDPMARYYNAQVGDIMKIITPSITSGYSVFYRYVKKSSLY